MGGPHRVAQVHAWVAHLNHARAQLRHQRSESGAGIGGHQVIDAEVTSPPSQPGADQRAIVIAGHQDHLALAPERGTERSEDSARLGHRSLSPALQELDDVA